MIQLLQAFAARVVAAIKGAELGVLQDDGTYNNLAAEQGRRAAWNGAATQFNNALGPGEEEKQKPILPDINITVDGNGVYTYTGIPAPQMTIGIDPGYHFFMIFNRYYSYGDGPIGDPNANNYYPGNQDA